MFPIIILDWPGAKHEWLTDWIWLVGCRLKPQLRNHFGTQLHFPFQNPWSRKILLQGQWCNSLLNSIFATRVCKMSLHRHLYKVPAYRIHNGGWESSVYDSVLILVNWICRVNCWSKVHCRLHMLLKNQIHSCIFIGDSLYTFFNEQSVKKISKLGTTSS